MIEARVRLREEDHVYLHDDGRQFASVSKLRKMVEEPFDAEMVSMRMAKGDVERGADSDGKTRATLLCRRVRCVTRL